MRAKFKQHRLEFKRPSGTSRGVLTTKDSWFLILKEKDKIGVGECSVLEGLSLDDPKRIESLLHDLCNALESGATLPDLSDWPAVQMGLELALLSLQSKKTFSIFPSDFSRG
jgi:O-succinylbenzoate synthase